jgi:hypothetical protein
VTAPRTVALCVRLSRAELAAIRRAAAAAGHDLTVSTWARSVLLAGLTVRGVDPPDPRQLPLRGVSKGPAVARTRPK